MFQSLITILSWLALRSSGASLPTLDQNAETPGLLTGSLAALALARLSQEYA